MAQTEQNNSNSQTAGSQTPPTTQAEQVAPTPPVNPQPRPAPPIRQVDRLLIGLDQRSGGQNATYPSPPPLEKK